MKIEFEESTHSYFFVKDGTRLWVPSITQVIRPLDNLSGIDPDVLDHAAERGKRVHAGTVLIEGGGDGSGLYWPGVPEEDAGYLRGWERFLDETGWRSREMEFVVGSWALKFAGTPDRAGEFRKGPHRGMPSVLEIKATSKMSPQHGVQLAGQKIAIEDWIDGILIRRRFVVYLKPNGTYHLERYKDDLDDRVAFLNCLAIQRWRAKHYPKGV